jgi:hypothetical protein
MTAPITHHGVTEVTVEQIKARLFDLIGHTCNGRLTIHPDRHRDPGDHECTFCSEYDRLMNKLLVRSNG